MLALFLVDELFILGKLGFSSICVLEFWLFIIVFLILLLFECAGIVAKDSCSYVAYGSFNLKMFFENLIVFRSSMSLSTSLFGTSSLKYYLMRLATMGISRICSVLGLEAGFTWTKDLIIDLISIE